jgi:N-methylhydantoinase A/oxoprolinase/acetone carboxylase beta subunit
MELPWDRLDAARISELVALFGRRYEELYGAGAGNVASGVEVNALRVDAVGAVPKPALRPAAEEAAAPAAPKGRRPVYVDGAFRDTPIYEWAEFRPGQQVSGPGVIESEFTTVLVPPAAEARLDAYGNVVLSLGGG